MTSSVIDAGDDLPLTLPALWHRQSRKHADRLLLACDDTRITYAEAEQRSRRLARGLLALGAIKGSHIALLYPNGPEFIIGMLAAARIGAVVLPLSTLSTAEELRWLLTHSDTAFLLAATEFRSHRYCELLQAAAAGAGFLPPATGSLCDGAVAAPDLVQRCPAQGARCGLVHRGAGGFGLDDRRGVPRGD